MIKNVTDIAAKRLTLRQRVRKYDGSDCNHKSVLVDERKACVECATCHALLNPVDVLLRFAREETQWKYERDAIRVAREQLAAKQRTKCKHCGKFTDVRA